MSACVLRAYAISVLALLGLSMSVPIVAAAQTASPEDRVAFGSSVHVNPEETVHDAVAFGGDTVVDGEVLGDAVAFGGSVILREGSSVSGDVAAFGGSVVDERVGSSARVDRSVSLQTVHDTQEGGFVGWVKDAVRSVLAHGLLFLLGLLLIGVTRERLSAMQTTMIKDGLRTAGAGFLGYVAAVMGIILLAVTLLGIPAAIVVAVALPVATYVGLAAAATVIGAALPIPRLAGHPVAQLGAGVAVLFVASLVPVVGGIATAIAACLGFGALIRTRFSPRPPADLPGGPGPFRTSATL